MNVAAPSYPYATSTRSWCAVTLQRAKTSQSPKQLTHNTASMPAHDYQRKAKPPQMPRTRAVQEGLVQEESNKLSVEVKVFASMSM